MTQAGPPTTIAPHPDPVAAALADPASHGELVRHARARLGAFLAGRPAAVIADAAEEVAQEAAGRALAKRGDFDREKSAVAWIHGILDLVVFEKYRSFRKLPAQPQADPAGWDGLAARLSAPDPGAELAELLARLPEGQRRIVVLHHLDDLSHEEIAAELGISVGASRTRLARAMKTLSDLAANGGGR